MVQRLLERPPLSQHQVGDDQRHTPALALAEIGSAWSNGESHTLIKVLSSPSLHRIPSPSSVQRWVGAHEQCTRTPRSHAVHQDSQLTCRTPGLPAHLQCTRTPLCGVWGAPPAPPPAPLDGLLALLPSPMPPSCPPAPPRANIAAADASLSKAQSGSSDPLSLSARFVRPPERLGSWESMIQWLNVLGWHDRHFDADLTAESS